MERMRVSVQVVSSSIVDKYIGESARLIREMFNYARDHQPCIIFMDEIDAIGIVLVYVVSLCRCCVLMLDASSDMLCGL